MADVRKVERKGPGATAVRNIRGQIAKGSITPGTKGFDKAIAGQVKQALGKTAAEKLAENLVKNVRAGKMAAQDAREVVAQIGKDLGLSLGQKQTIIDRLSELEQPAKEGKQPAGETGDEEYKRTQEKIRRRAERAKEAEKGESFEEAVGRAKSMPIELHAELAKLQRGAAAMPEAEQKRVGEEIKAERKAEVEKLQKEQEREDKTWEERMRSGIEEWRERSGIEEWRKAETKRETETRKAAEWQKKPLEEKTADFFFGKARNQKIPEAHLSRLAEGVGIRTKGIFGKPRAADVIFTSVFNKYLTLAEKNERGRISAHELKQLEWMTEDIQKIRGGHVQTATGGATSVPKAKKHGLLHRTFNYVQAGPGTRLERLAYVAGKARGKPRQMVQRGTIPPSPIAQGRAAGAQQTAGPRLKIIKGKPWKRLVLYNEEKGRLERETIREMLKRVGGRELKQKIPTATGDVVVKIAKMIEEAPNIPENEKENLRSRLATAQMDKNVRAMRKICKKIESK